MRLGRATFILRIDIVCLSLPLRRVAVAVALAQFTKLGHDAGTMRRRNGCLVVQDSSFTHCFSLNCSDWFEIWIELKDMAVISGKDLSLNKFAVGLSVFVY